jgi:hypothetical protein
MKARSTDSVVWTSISTGRKEVIRIRISMMTRQHNDQKKKDKKANSDLENIHLVKTMIE